MTDAYRAPSDMRRRPVRVGDVVASIILLVLGAIAFAVLAFASLFLAMMSDGCGSGTNCNYGVMTAGYFVALLVPPVVFVAAAIWTIIRLVRRRLAWWVPLVGAAVALAAWGVGLAMMQASLGR